jgi:hypothetical protein
VLSVVWLILSRSVAYKVVKEKAMASIMTTLSSIYKKPFAKKRVHMMKKLFNLKVAEGILVAQHLNKLNTITNQLSLVEIDLDDAIYALIVLASLPNS